MATAGTQQSAPGITQPQREHQWLQRLVGEWTYEGEVTMEPGKTSEHFAGTETVRPLGDLWVMAEGQSQMDEGIARTVITLGYDPEKRRFMGTYLVSMMARLWVYEGSLDADEKVLTLETEGPSMVSGGKHAEFRDTMEVKDDNHRVFYSHMLGDDGQWRTFMTVDYRRKG